MTHVLIQEEPVSTSMAFLLISFIVSYVFYRIHRRCYFLTSLIIIIFFNIILGLVIVQSPSSVTVSYGAIIVIIAHALLGSLQGTIVMLITLVSVSVAWHLGHGARLVDPGIIVEMGILFVTATIVAWITQHPLQALAESALTGWTRAREALDEARQRRGELYRVVRAFEEATYRIERMNNELIVARREAELARALKARFSTMVSHELRGPLNLILGFSAMMALSPEKYEEPLPDCYLADVDAIYRNSEHLAVLVDDILDLSQIEVERLPLVKDRLDVEHDVIRKVLEIIRPLAERKGLRIHAEISQELPWIIADAVRLRQVLLNLLNNALRHTERGSITVHATNRERDLLISVRDTGVGIPSEHIPKLFQEFTGIQLSDTGEQGGSGLGLSISKHLVELHGGEIWVESQKGVGTVFSFTVPLPGIANLPTRVSTGQIPQLREMEKVCLLVNDDLVIARLLGRHLEGYHVIGVPNEQQILGLIEQLHPRAIITYPGMDQQIERQLEDAPYDVPIVSFDLSHPEQDYLSGIASYLVKPIAAESLRTVMQQTLSSACEEPLVLLVDDEPDALRLLERMLTSLPYPYKILRAYGGKQALELMKGEIPDVVLLDLIMPDLSGEEVIQGMRADENLCDVPVVIISAQDVVEGSLLLSRSISIRSQKPFDISLGTRCLRTLLDMLSPDYLPDPAPS
jgi:signal transduction histidine kinase/CheY-like chemotaxis protein